MKKFTKIMLSTAAITAVSAAMAVSAMAMTAEYKPADGEGYKVGTVVLSGVAGTGTSQTLLVLDTVDLQTVTENNIKQIDQKDDSTVFVNVPVGDLEDGTYEVRIGGSEAVDNQLQIATFTVGSEPGGGDEPGGGYDVQIIIGDIDGRQGVKVADASAVANYLAGKSTTANANIEKKYELEGGGTFQVGDIDGRQGIKVADASAIANYLAGKATTANAKITGEPVNARLITE